MKLFNKAQNHQSFSAFLWVDDFVLFSVAHKQPAYAHLTSQRGVKRKRRLPEVDCTENDWDIPAVRNPPPRRRGRASEEPAAINPEDVDQELIAYDSGESVPGGLESKQSDRADQSATTILADVGGGTGHAVSEQIETGQAQRHAEAAKSSQSDSGSKSRSSSSSSSVASSSARSKDSKQSVEGDNLGKTRDATNRKLGFAGCIT